MNSCYAVVTTFQIQEIYLNVLMILYSLFLQSVSVAVRIAPETSTMDFGHLIEMVP